MYTAISWEVYLLHSSFLGVLVSGREKMELLLFGTVQSLRPLTLMVFLWRLTFGYELIYPNYFPHSWG